RSRFGNAPNGVFPTPITATGLMVRSYQPFITAGRDRTADRQPVRTARRGPAARVPGLCGEIGNEVNVPLFFQFRLTGFPAVLHPGAARYTPDAACCRFVWFLGKKPLVQGHTTSFGVSACDCETIEASVRSRRISNMCFSSSFTSSAQAWSASAQAGPTSNPESLQIFVAATSVSCAEPAAAKV